MLPLAEDTQALEVRALQRHKFFRKSAAGAADFNHRHAGFARPQLLVHVDFDRQAVAVPPGNKGRVEASQSLRLDDQVLKDFGQRRAQVQAPVRIRRAVMKRE